MAALPSDLAAQIKYGAETGSRLRRSEYLADALKQLNGAGSANIRSPGELGAKLLATAILNRAGKSADRDALRSIQDQQTAESDSLLASLRPPGPPPAAPPLPQAPQPQAMPPPQPQPQPEPAPQTAPTGFQAAPQDREALIRAIATEAGGEGPEGMAAAAHVVMNRLKAGYGGAKSIADVVFQPHQFEGITRGHQPDQQTLAGAQAIADQVLAGKIPDPTNGAMAFLNPQLQVQLGRNIPNWAQGEGHRIGNHVFYGGSAQAAAAPPPPPPPPDPNGPAVQTVGQPGPVADQPFQVASNGPIEMPSQPSAPGFSPPGAGAAPAALTPQAGAAGAMAQGITPEQLGFLEKLLRNPRTHEAGMAYAMELQKKAAEPVKYQTQMVNNVPAWLDPEHPGQMTLGAIPDAARTHALTGTEAARFNVPPGTVVQIKPTGEMSFEKPANGQMVTSAPGGPYAEHYIPGGTNDPTVPQKAPAGYQYGAGGQTAVSGGPADPHAPMNVAAGAEKIQAAIHPILNLVTKAKQSAGAVTEGYRLQNGTGDIAMVNGLQHLIDDGVVRGEDVNMQMKSSGVSGSFGQIAQYVNSGGLLTPEIRNKVLQASKGLFNSIDQQYKAQVLSHRATTDALYGPGAFDTYVMPLDYQRTLGWAAPDGAPAAPPAATPQQQPQFAPGTREAAIAEARRRKLIQ